MARVMAPFGSDAGVPVLPVHGGRPHPGARLGDLGWTSRSSRAVDLAVGCGRALTMLDNEFVTAVRHQ
jgi:hypothetical protein